MHRLHDRIGCVLIFAQRGYPERVITRADTTQCKFLLDVKTPVNQTAGLIYGFKYSVLTFAI